MSIRVPLVAACLIVLASGSAEAERSRHRRSKPDDDARVQVGGYLQPQGKIQQNDPVAQNDENGFRLARARLTIAADRSLPGLEVGARLEGELTPTFELLDAYAFARTTDLPGDGQVEVDLGQVKAPVSRQTLVSDAELQMVEKAELTGLAPDRQLGARAVVHVPYVPMLELSAGMFNGEGRNQVENIDENYLWVGRVALRPFGTFAPLVEGPFGPDALSIGFSIARNASRVGDFGRLLTWIGVDAFGSWHGLSGTAEYLQETTDPSASAPDPKFRANGLNLQAGYLLPFRGALHHKLEIAFRLEEIDRNDTVPIERKGDPNQSLRRYIVGLNYYQLGHDLKAQLNLEHIDELENLDRNGQDASYANDLVLLQVSYRL